MQTAHMLPPNFRAWMRSQTGNGLLIVLPEVCLLPLKTEKIERPQINESYLWVSIFIFKSSQPTREIANSGIFSADSYL